MFWLSSEGLTHWLTHWFVLIVLTCVISITSQSVKCLGRDAKIALLVAV